MRIIFYIFLFIPFSVQVFAQQNSICGVWRTPSDFSVLTYTFDSSGHVSHKQRGCMSGYELSGIYTFRNDSIFIYYDTLTPIQQQVFRIKDSIIAPDTLIYINEHKIKIASTLFMYNQDRDEQVCSITPGGLFSFKIKHFGDTFVLKQLNYNEWETIDTLINPADEYINLTNYPLFLHSGSNKFAIYINNKSYLSHSFPDGIIVQANKPPVKIINKSAIYDQVLFSDTTIYEVQDCYGRKLLSGKGKCIDCNKLPKGKYFLNFDNRTTEFVKR